ncbi:hypothetical protein EST38_g12264 [Candolleomyces aberdarensis]|uniref:Uncharacterized protein n=1 Tax=Candolleomyces aberdarensis TaxID=2316362 RepID=A0A4Q2D545_9AGAR|nr:hypothetical protein EST38_g12264 [Candolleomyces aberdarensis]
MAPRKTRKNSRNTSSATQDPPATTPPNELGELQVELERLRQSTEAQLAEARAEVAEARAQAEAAEARAQAQAAAVPAVRIVRIPRPRGGKGGLQAAMGLEDDDELYASIQRTVRRAVIQAGIDLHSTLSDISVEKLANVFKKVRETHPYMDRQRFSLDWPTLELVKQYLRNHRKYSLKVGRLAPYSRSRSTQRLRNVDDDISDNGDGEAAA